MIGLLTHFADNKSMTDQHMHEWKYQNPGMNGKLRLQHICGLGIVKHAASNSGLAESSK